MQKLMVIFISIFIVITDLKNSAMADNVPALTDVKSAIAVDATKAVKFYMKLKKMKFIL